MADQIVSWGGFNSKGTSGLGVTGSISVVGSGSFGYSSIANGNTYIKIDPNQYNSRITFNDFDGGISSRGGELEMSTYYSRLTYGSYNWFYIGNPSYPYLFYIGDNRRILISEASSKPTNATAMLQVKGTGTTSSTTSLLVQNSGGTERLRIYDDGYIRLGTSNLYLNGAGGSGYSAPTGQAACITQNTAQINFQSPANATSGVMFQFSDNLNTGYVSDLYGDTDAVRIFRGFKNPNSAWNYTDLKIDPTYQGVGGSVTIRGLYYNPSNTLTGNYTIRAIETTTGSVVFNGGNVGIGTSTPSSSLHISGAFLGYPVTVPTASGTASLDCNLGNFFNLTLSSSYTLFLSASNVQPGQTINLRVTQPATSGSLNYGSQFKFAGGIPYSASATGSAVDIISFITFDTTNLYGSAIKNLS